MAHILQHFVHFLPLHDGIIVERCVNTAILGCLDPCDTLLDVARHVDKVKLCCIVDIESVVAHRRGNQQVLITFEETKWGI